MNFLRKLYNVPPFIFDFGTLAQKFGPKTPRKLSTASFRDDGDSTRWTNKGYHSVVSQNEITYVLICSTNFVLLGHQQYKEWLSKGYSLYYRWSTCSAKYIEYFKIWVISFFETTEGYPTLSSTAFFQLIKYLLLMNSGSLTA